MKKKILAAFAVATILFGTVGCELEATDSKAKDGGGGKADSSQTTDDDTEPAADTEPDTYKPSKDDFKAKLKVTSKSCFGSAGCNVEYKVGLAWLGPAGAKLDKSYDVYFQVTGGDDGGSTATITVTPKLRYAVYEGYGSTAEGGQLDVKIKRIGSAGGF